MVSSTFFDTHKPRGLRQAAHDIPGLFGTGSGGGGFAGSFTSKSRRKGEQHSYKLYNYLAVKRTSAKFAQQTPSVGMAVPSSQVQSVRQGPKGPKRLSMREKKWLKQNYGARVIQSMDDEIELLPMEHPLLRLLGGVNPVDWWSSFAFEVSMFWMLTGEYFIWMVPSNMRSAVEGVSLPSQLWVLPTPWVTPMYAKSGELTHYKVLPGGDTRRKQDIPHEEIIHGFDKSPFSKTRGYSPSVAGGSWLDSSVAIEESRINAFENSIDPSWWLRITDPDMDPTDPMLMKIQERMMQTMSGIGHHREPQIIPPGMEIDTNTGLLKPKEMDYPESSKNIRDVNLALHGVNKFVAGFTEDMNRAQAQVALIQFCEIVLNPMLGMFSGALQERLAPLYDEKIRIWFNDCSPEDREMALKELELQSKSGARSPNEIRQFYGIPTVDDDDYNAAYIPGGMVPLGQNASDHLPDDDDDEDQALARAMYQGNGERDESVYSEAIVDR